MELKQDKDNLVLEFSNFEIFVFATLRIAFLM